MLARTFRPLKNDQWRVRLSPVERTLLRSLPEQAMPLVGSEDPSVQRLFPPAYVGVDHTDAQADYRVATAGELADHHRQALAELAASAGNPVISTEQLHLWLGALEALRLVLGTQLDVNEHHATGSSEHTDNPRYAVYYFLSSLQDQVVGALATTLGEPDPSASPPDWPPSGGSAPEPPGDWPPEWGSNP
jgi:hypothetical protein